MMIELDNLRLTLFETNWLIYLLDLVYWSHDYACLKHFIV